MRTPLSTIALSSLLLSSAVAHAAGPSPLPALPYETYRLDNGLEVILSPDKRIPLAHVQVWYHVGSKDEQVGKTGFAHLFEHMMFQGSRDIAEDTWFKRLDAVGGYGINGTTNTERTNYYESVPSHQLPLALWMESDRMGFLLDAVNDQSLKNQQDVVRNERRQSYEMRPYGMTHKATLEALYPVAHPYHHTTIGEHEDLERASLDDVKGFFRTWYVPANATLAIVGNFEPAEAKKLVEKFFGPLPKVVVPARTKPPVLDGPVVREVKMEANVQLPHFSYVWHGPVPFGPDDLELDLFSHMLGGGKTSRLYKRLVFDARIAQQVSVENDSREYGGDFDIDVMMKPDHTIAEGRAAVDAELARLEKEPFTADELARARIGIEADLVRALETNAGRAGRLQMANHYVHDAGEAVKVIARYRNITLEQVNAAYKRTLGHPKLVLTVERNAAAPLGGRIIGSAPTPPAPAPVASAKPVTAAVAPAAAPVAKAAPAVEIPAAEAWRKEAPPAGPVPAVTLPAPQRGKLANGLPIVVVENHAVPVVELYLMVFAGNERVEPARFGLADLTATLLTEGTKQHDSLAFAAALESLGARFSAGAGPDSAYISLNTLSERLDPALDLFAETLTAPAFTQADFDRVRDRRLASLLEQKDSPSEISRNATRRVVFGEQHPYAFSSLGTEASLAGLTRENVIAFFTRYYVPGNAQLVVVGDTSLPEIRKALDARLSGAAGWQARPGMAKGKPTKAPAADKSPRKVFIIDKPKASQSVIGFAQVGVARSNPDYIPLLVANSILGGAFSSRINMNLREKHGYSYGARSAFSFTRGPGLFFAGGSVKANVTREALVELKGEIERFLSAPVTAEELAETKSSLIGKLPSQFETNGGVAGMLSDLITNDLPLDWYASYSKKVAAVTAADVQRVARKYLTPARQQLIIVGDRASIEPAIADLGLGAVEARGPLGEPVIGDKAPAPAPAK